MIENPNVQSYQNNPFLYIVTEDISFDDDSRF